MNLSTDHDFLSRAFSAATGINIVSQRSSERNPFQRLGRGIGNLVLRGSIRNDMDLPSIDMNSMHKQSLQWNGERYDNF